MNLVVPIYYEATVQTPSGQEKRFYQDEVELRLPVVTRSGLDLVIQGDDDHRFPDYYHLDGRFLVDSGCDASDSRIFALATFLHGEGFGKVNVPTMAGARGGRGKGMVRRKGRPRPDATVTSDLDQVRERLLGILGDAVLLGDRILVPCLEPYLSRREQERDGLRMRHGRFDGYERTFGPDEAAHLSHEMPRGVEWKVLRPDLLKTDHSFRRLVHMSSAIVGATASDVGFQDRHVVEAWMDLRSSTYTRWADGAPEGASLAASTERFLEAYEGVDLRYGSTRPLREALDDYRSGARFASLAAMAEDESALEGIRFG